MATLVIPLLDCTFAPAVRIHMMQDHYAILADDVVVGTIERSPGPGNEGMWGVHFLDGSNPCSYVPLHYAMQSAMKWQRS